MALKGIIGVSFFAVFLYVVVNIINFLNPIEVPKLENEYWGKGGFREDDKSIKPFEIKITDKEIQDIYHRLNLTRPLIEPFEDTQTQYGFTGNILKTFLDFLKNEYDFKERVKFLNSLPQFTTEIQGLNLHFIHVKPKADKNIKVVPILLLHGWPSSIREFYEIIPKLTTVEKDRNFVFDVVAASLPGFGYSEGSYKKDCQGPEVAVMFKNLMNRLGYQKFYVHGSDWGGIIVTHLATLFPNSTLGHHSNFCSSLTYKSLLKIGLGMVFPSLVFEEENSYYWYPPTKSIRFFFSETGYYHLQGTKPDTIGVSLDQSLEGLFSFLLEKLSIGANRNNIYLDNAGLALNYDYTTIMDTLIFYYWLPQKGTTAARIYAENSNVYSFAREIHNIPISEKVPCGCLFPRNDFWYFPDHILKDKYPNLVHSTVANDLGHFTALENPVLLSEDIIVFVNKTL